MRGRGPWGNHKALIETLRTRPLQMREHGYPIVCLSASSHNTGSTLCSRIMHFPSYMAAFQVDRQDLYRLRFPTAVIPSCVVFRNLCHCLSVSICQFSYCPLRSQQHRNDPKTSLSLIWFHCSRDVLTTQRFTSCTSHKQRTLCEFSC